MANTRKSAKRAEQAVRRRERNTMVRSATRTAVKNALDAVRAKDPTEAKAAYMAAIKALSKAASKGSIPKARAARKTSRLTRFLKKVLPDAVSAK